MSTKKNILVLGSTGSIGCQTLDVIAKHSDKLNLTGVVAYSHFQKMNSQANYFEVPENRRVIVAGNDDAAKQIEQLISDDKTDIVVNAMSGAAGLRASYQTLQHDKVLALANKESLVVGGDLIMPLAKQRASQHGGLQRLLPIDSEHGAIFQCLVGEKHDEISRLWITASGGPFRNTSAEKLSAVTPKQALGHPTWNMGPKITIDSATMMNKGLEVIEAHHLFGISYDNIKVVVQPQSAVHSMVEFCDGSVKAHLGPTDMRIPIQFCLSFPQRWDMPVQQPTDFTKIGSLEFEAPDLDKFPALRIAFEAGRQGGLMPCVMNAANEVAVADYLAEKIAFTDIAAIVERVMDEFSKLSCANDQVESLQQLSEIDKWARQAAK